jgi:hypothetical protein
VPERRVDILPDCPKDAVTESMDALVYGPTRARAFRRGAQPLHLGHIDPPSERQQGLNHAMVAARGEHRAALPEDRRIPAAAHQRNPAQCMGQLMPIPKYQAVACRSVLQRIQRGAQAARIQDGK